jgi:hypothetical protein
MDEVVRSLVKVDSVNLNAARFNFFVGGMWGRLGYDVNFGP